MLAAARRCRQAPTLRPVGLAALPLFPHAPAGVRRFAPRLPARPGRWAAAAPLVSPREEPPAPGWVSRRRPLPCGSAATGVLLKRKLRRQGQVVLPVLRSMDRLILCATDRRVKIQCFITSSSVQTCCVTSSRAQVTTPV